MQPWLLSDAYTYLRTKYVKYGKRVSVRGGVSLPVVTWELSNRKRLFSTIYVVCLMFYQTDMYKPNITQFDLQKPLFFSPRSLCSQLYRELSKAGKGISQRGSAHNETGWMVKAELS